MGEPGLLSGGIFIGAGVRRPELIWDRKMYLTVFDGDFSVRGEVELPSRRYNPGTAWCALGDGLLLYVENGLSPEELKENLVFDKVTWE